MKKFNLYITLSSFLLSVLILGLFLSVFSATSVFAATAPLEYELLANDLPGLEDASTPNEYLKGMIKLLIGLMTALAVIMIVIAGVQHVWGATKESSRSAAKEKMWGAVLGLTLALISYVILNTINPDLLILDITLPP